MSKDNLNKVINDFLARIEEINGLFLDSLIGIMMYNKYVNDNMNTCTADSKISMGDGDPNDPGNIILHKTTVGSLKERTKKSGQDIKIISNLCIIAIYQYWEDQYREKIAKLKGFGNKSDLKSDLFGEIRYLRQAIIHHKGKKIKEFNKLKILNFVKDRNSVYFSKEEFDFLFRLVKDEIEKIKLGA